MGRMLLISCSKAKREEAEPLPAIERYDGPLFRVVRKFLREAPESLQDVDIYVLSAKYGFVGSATKIENYDERMTEERVMQLRDEVIGGLEQAVAGHRPDELFLCLGRGYLETLNGYEERIPASVEIRVSNESAARKQTALKAWLWDEPLPSTPTRAEGAVQQPELPLAAPRSVQIRGQTLNLSKEETIERARQALSQGWGDPDRYRTWYAIVDGRRVSSKWWVSYLSGLPLRAFVADEARRVLRALGIEVLSVDS